MNDERQDQMVTSRRSVDGLISISEAAERGIDRVREPQWADPLDHIKIDLLGNGKMGPWIHLYSPFNQECNGHDPEDMLFINFDCQSKYYVPYDGALPDSEEYLERQSLFTGKLFLRG